MRVHRILYISKLALVCLLFYTVFKTTGSLGNIGGVLAPVSAKTSVQPIRYEAKPSLKLSIEDFAKIIKKDPFGTSNNGTSSDRLPSNPNPIQLDSSFARQSGLTLMGTISGSSSVARAIIKNGQSNTLGFYKIGQFVGDARIDSIEANAVIVFHDGQKKILPITSWASTNGIKRSRMASLPAATGEYKVVAAKIEQNRLETGIRKKMKSAQEMLAKTTIKPYIVKGHNEGLQISGLENMIVANFAEKIGLKNGDVISAINGHRLTSKQRAYQILKRARHQKRLSLDLIRGNKPKNISFALPKS